MDLAGKTALVTGATGFLGGALARRLAADGVQVRALARRPNRDRYIRDVAGIEIIMGDITDANRMREVLAGCDVVFHMAAALGGSLAVQQPVNVDGTRHIMQAAAHNGVQRVVHVSTIAVYGYGYRGLITEDMPQKPGHVPYNVSKSQAEAVVRTIGEADNVPYSIIRPGMIYGPHSSGWTDTMFKLAKRPPVMWLGDGSGTVYTVYVDDVVDLCVLLATHEAAIGEAFNCVGVPHPTWRDFLLGYARLAGHQRWLGVPVPLARLIAPLADIVLTWRGEPQDVRDVIGFVQGQTQFSMDKTRDLLGWQPQVGLDEGIQRCVPYLREKDLLT